MVGLRQALLFSVAERYVAIALNFLMVATLARLLTPEEFGYSVIGAATIGFAECLRDFGTSGFLVQTRTVTSRASRTAFTVMLVLSLSVAGALWLAAGPISAFYGTEGLKFYLQVTALGLLSGPFAAPPLALLRREMRFRAVAIINVASAVTIAAVTVGLAVLGASYMSFAWGILAGAYITAILAVLFHGDVGIFRPGLSEWRAVLSFGSYSSAAGICTRLQEFVPSLIVGRIMDFGAVGLFSRAVMVCQLPDKCLLNGLLPVALPALAAEARAGRSLADAYLRGTALITAVQWPALLLLACLAHPAVLVLLGDQWLAIVPLVQIIALGQLCAFPTILSYPLLAAAGGIRHAMTGALAALATVTCISAVAAPLGLGALAAGVAVTTAVQAMVSLHLVRRRAPFPLGDMVRALRKSMIVAMASALVPLMALAVDRFHGSFSILQGVMIGAGSVAVWVAAICWARHPLAAELNLVAQAVMKMARGAARALHARIAIPRRSRAGI